MTRRRARPPLPVGPGAAARSGQEARLLKHHHIGTEHILLGLLDAPDSRARGAAAAPHLHRYGTHPARSGQGR
ncbi:Clp protease N-terminal domain-containing protein [Streptomyces sp. 11-1-2]|uniref:Clp protease N-terminal domain-containing protein n=1 Tax=unclassified Streptomyces TaxID=2593676 RepID=UPI001F08ACB8|nr:Clp protease N-terminal domain-containing protein [Streptomyces sp. 11-1-2]